MGNTAKRIKKIQAVRGHSQKVHGKEQVYSGTKFKKSAHGIFFHSTFS